MATELIINGKPLVKFTFDYIPSWNEYVDRAKGHRHFGGSGMAKQWRNKGLSIAARFMAECGPKDRDFLITKRALVVVKVYRATEHVYDVANVYMKGLMDGFTDAGIWRDDDWAHVPYCLFAWCWMDKDDPKGQRFEVEIHDLARVVLDGVAQTLPTGRIVKQ